MPFQSPLVWSTTFLGTKHARALAALLPPELHDAQTDATTEFLARRAVGRALAWHLLRKTVPGRWTIEVDARGKPVALGAEVRHISIAHSGAVIAAAVSAIGPVGIDVERRSAKRDLNALARAAFGPAEQAAVAAQGLAVFYRFWTVREAMGKATGDGLALAADGIDRVPVAMTDSAWIAGNTGWMLIHDVIAQDFSLALAVHSPADGSILKAGNLARSRLDLEGTL